MIGTGTIANVAAIVLGGAVGLVARGGLKEHYQEGLMKAMGLGTLFIGAAGAMAGALSVQGGKLASLPEGARAKLAALRPEESPAGLAFHFLQGVRGVTVVLSGMSTLEQVEENVRTWSEDKPLDEAEFEAVLGVGRGLFTEGALPCTACRYCVSRCPQGLDIPELLRLYNDYVFSGPRAYHVINVIEAMPEEKRPAACIACGSCAGVCPQQLPIPETFAKLTELLAKEE